MSGSGEKELDQKFSYDKLLEKHDEAMEQNILIEKLAALKELSNHIFETTVTNLSSEFNVAMSHMMETKEWLHIGVNLSAANLENEKAAREIEAKKQKSILAARDAEYKEKVEQLAIVKDECGYLQDTLKQKRNLVDKGRKIVTVGTSFLKKQNYTLSGVMLALEQQSMEDQKGFQTDAAKLTDLVNLQKAENDNIRKRNAIMSEELDALDNERRSNLDELAKLQAIVDFNDAIYEREERNNQKLEKKIQSTRQRKMDDIARMEQEMVELRTAYESLKQINDNLRALNQKDLGDTMSFEENMSKARATLNQSKLDCAKLNFSIDAAKDEKVRGENVLSEIFQMNEQEIELHVSLPRDLPIEDRDSMPPSNPRINADRGQTSRQPTTAGRYVQPAKKPTKRRFPQQAPSEQIPLGQNEELKLTIRCAESSVLESYAGPLEVPEEHNGGMQE